MLGDPRRSSPGVVLLFAPELVGRRSRPASTPTELAQTTELTRIMVLVADVPRGRRDRDQRPQRARQVRGVRARPARLQPRDHRRAPCSSCRRSGSRASPYGVVIGRRRATCWSSCRRSRRLGARLRPRVDLRDDQARLALVLMVPRAHRPRGDPARVPGHDEPRVDARPTGRSPMFNFAFAMLQIPIGVIGVPLGIVLLPSLAARGGDRRAPRRSRHLLVARPRDPRLRDDRDRGARDRRVAGRGPAAVRLRGRSARPRSTRPPPPLAVFLLGLTAHSLIAVLARAFYALQDTKTPGRGGARSRSARTS